MFLVFSNSLFSGDGILVKESIGFYSKILNKEVKYTICLPQDYYKTKASYPVVYMLHGLGDDESSWLEYGQIDEVSKRMVKNKEIVPMVYIMPEGYTNYYVNDFAGTFLYQDMFVKELVPMIDSMYRTIADASHRATIGYSMGGFGALILPLKHPEMFSVAVPLSISVRTDSQYMIEDGSEWDQQWGRLFGGVGTIGEERITQYYKENSPFHIIKNEDLSKFKNLKIYIDNGDDENTLCRSNEELHILMREKSLPHEFRVRNGGHEFEYWQEALPNGLRFISDAFDGKEYRGDRTSAYPPKKIKAIAFESFKNADLILPQDYSNTMRFYPIVYISGSLSPEEKQKAGMLIKGWIDGGKLSPVILAFIPGFESVEAFGTINTELESRYRIRKGYRFRGLVSYREFNGKTISSCMDSLLFTSVAIMDGKPDFEDVARLFQTSDKKERSKTWYYFDSPDKGLYFAENGNMHVLLRERKFYHEYRVREGEGGFEWFLKGLFEAIHFTENKIHN